MYEALLAICNEGDEIIIPTPCWVSYKELVKMSGGVPVMVPGHLRFTYSASMEELKNAMDHIENALKKLGTA
nr:aminotransferase class I/II-fold pyridoxal phosphate-dependent enzyme [uncultured Dorea sp.]